MSEPSGSGEASKPRVALVGARRVRQGLGPYVAKHLAAAGAEIVGLIGTSPASCRQAEGDIEGSAGLRVPGYTDLSQLVKAHAPHALAVLCPPEAHGHFLDQALEQNLHVLCEKPLQWTDSGERDAEDSCERVFRFRDKGLYLAENCQWPEVLPGIQALEPAILDRPSLFGMGLEPATSGLRMLGDALSHPLSVLEALLPGPARIDRTQATWGPEGRAVDLDFRWTTSAGSLITHIELRSSDRNPRGAWIELDSVRFERLVRPEDYAMFLSTGARVHQIEDPLVRHLRGFVSNLTSVLAGSPAPDPTPLADRARMLDQLRTACGIQST